eukprot:scaffold15896_cov74-Skeletonema_dohrnii-CCMP3373.AAC.1
MISYYPSPSPCGSLDFHSIIHIHHRRQCCITTSPCGSLDDWRPWITLLLRLTAHSAVVVMAVVDVGDDDIGSCGDSTTATTNTTAINNNNIITNIHHRPS